MKKDQKEQDYKGSVYIDANCFIYATINMEKTGNSARSILEKVKNGFYKAYTSTLTIDEYIWKVKKEAGREKAAEGARAILSFDNLQLINIGEEIITKSIEIFKEKNLDPRDAIHLSAMQSKNIKTIFSSDPDLDKIQGIKRIDFSK